jgi:hypothetical protein
MRWYLRYWKYGISRDEFYALLEAQAGLCYNVHCRDEYGARTQLNDRTAHVDHDHATKAIRKLLCAGCNLALGHAKHSPECLRGLAAYIEEHTAVEA